MPRTLTVLNLLITVGLFVGLTTGCDRGETLQAVTGDVVFGIVDSEPGQAGPPHSLFIETVDVYPNRCPLWINWDIGQKVEVEILGVDLRGLCFPGEAPARVNIPFGVPDRAYDFELEHRGQTDLYRLVVGGGEVAVETISASVSCHIDDLIVTDEGRMCDHD